MGGGSRCRRLLTGVVNGPLFEAGLHKKDGGAYSCPMPDGYGGIARTT